MTLSANPGGYRNGAQPAALSYKCANRRHSECTKVNCTCECHARENNFKNTLAFEKANAASSHS